MMTNARPTANDVQFKNGDHYTACELGMYSLRDGKIYGVFIGFCFGFEFEHLLEQLNRVGEH